VSRVNVNPELLKWAIDRLGDHDIVEAKFPNLSKWLNGELKPTLKQLEDFAKTTHTPIGYLFMSDPPEEKFPIPHYRTLGNVQDFRPSPNLIETIRTMERRQEWMRDYLIDIGRGPLEFVGSAANQSNPKKIAQNMRDIMGLKTNWASKKGSWQDALNDLLQAIQDIGILVMVNGIVGNNTHRKLSVDEFRGFILVDDYAPLIFINGADGKAAQMFTISHELAHVWLGASAAFDLNMLQPSNDETEILCNKIAAEFLVPEIDFMNLWEEVKYNDDKYQQIARYFKVSELVVVKRALDLNFISFSKYKAFYKEREEYDIQRRIDSSDGGGNFYNTANWRIGPMFADAIISRVTEGKMLYREAYQLTGIRGITFDTFVKKRTSNRRGYNG